MYLEEQWLRKDNREYTDNMTDSENRDHFIRHERWINKWFKVSGHEFDNTDGPVALLLNLVKESGEDRIVQHQIEKLNFYLISFYYYFSHLLLRGIFVYCF